MGRGKSGGEGGEGVRKDGEEEATCGGGGLAKEENESEKTAGASYLDVVSVWGVEVVSSVVPARSFQVLYFNVPKRHRDAEEAFCWEGTGSGRTLMHVDATAVILTEVESCL